MSRTISILPCVNVKCISGAKVEKVEGGGGGGQGSILELYVRTGYCISIHNRLGYAPPRAKIFLKIWYVKGWWINVFKRPSSAICFPPLNATLSSSFIESCCTPQGTLPHRKTSTKSGKVNSMSYTTVSMRLSAPFQSGKGLPGARALKWKADVLYPTHTCSQGCW